MLVGSVGDGTRPVRRADRLTADSPARLWAASACWPMWIVG